MIHTTLTSDVVIIGNDLWRYFKLNIASHILHEFKYFLKLSVLWLLQLADVSICVFIFFIILEEI